METEGNPVLVREVKIEKTYAGRLPCGGDLLEEIRKLCKEKNIRFGAFEALGAVQSAKIAFYDQKKRAYREISLPEPMEIASLIANISEKDGEIFIHAHITLAKENGSAFGGHLIPGTVILACEFVARQFDGPVPTRHLDEETGLSLWKSLS